jgi:hypothetical protein
VILGAGNRFKQRVHPSFGLCRFLHHHRHCWVGLSTAAILLLKNDTTHTHMETKWRPPALVCHRNHVTSPAIVKLNRVEQYVPAASRLAVSVIARRGFVPAYRRYHKGHHMAAQTWCRWLRRRSGFLARHLAQYNKKPTHRRWLSMMMWAFEADPPPASSKA